MSGDTTMIRATTVNHVQVEIACPPARIWRMILDDYGAGQGFARHNYRIDPLDDPATPLGGYRMTLEGADMADERICRIVERDDAAMRLSLHARYLSPSTGNAEVYATYQAMKGDGGATYRLDCFGTIDHAVPPGATREEIAASIAALTANSDRALHARFLGAKAELEAEDAD